MAMRRIPDSLSRCKATKRTCSLGSAMLRAVTFDLARWDCMWLRERPEEVVEADVRCPSIPAYGENGQRLKIEMTPHEVDQETARWTESIADFGSMTSN